jgi:trans-aconitate 2-methyltransferase
MTRGTWNPDQYERFADERAQPFRDLAALVDPGPVERVVDLGCGSGQLTAELAGLLAAPDVLGIDTSPAMLQRASAHERVGLRFEQADIGTWHEPDAYDVVFANASLHWVADHEAVLARWRSSLRPAGQLAVQVPANADHPSHLTSVEVASTEPFASAMGGTPPPDPVASNVLTPARYAEVLYDLGFGQQHVRLQVYGHVLESTAEVVEWVKGTSLTRFFAALPDGLHQPFVDAYTESLLARLGTRAPFFYPFKRILMWAHLP